jgi:hypothetical protein
MALASSCSRLCPSSPSTRCTRKSTFYESCTVLSDGRNRGAVSNVRLIASLLSQSQEWIRTRRTACR